MCDVLNPIMRCRRFASCKDSFVTLISSFRAPPLLETAEGGDVSQDYVSHVSLTFAQLSAKDLNCV